MKSLLFITLLLGTLPAAAQVDTGQPSASAATAWTETFPPQAAGTWLEGSQRKVLVAGAGEPAAEARAAAQALEAAWRASGQSPLVMGDAALGGLTTDSDAQVVQKAAPLPVDAVAVVRVFAGAPGAPSTAVVTLYDKAGKVLTAFTAAQGVALAAKAGAGAGGAVPSAALAAVDVVGRGGSEAQAKYDEKYVWFEDGALVNVYNGRVMRRFTLAYQGKYKKHLEGDAFYEAVGRSDLAAQYRSRRTRRTLLLTGGSLAAVGGGTMTLFGLMGPCVKEDARSFACLERDKGLLVPGLVLAGGGMVALLMGATTEPHPVDAPEVRRIADEYNQKLKGELGLAEAPRRHASPGLELQVGALLTPGGGALVLGGTL